MNKRYVKKQVEYITKQIIDKYHPQKIILFGSAAWGEFTKDSDLDFLIIKKHTPYYGRDRMKELEDLIEYDLPVDLLVYRPDEFDERVKMGDPFIKLIILKGKVLYG